MNVKIPQHVALIMDGNGRWARHQKMPRVFGHKKGAERVRELVETAGNMGVKALTLYAFSEENWRRPAEEVNALFSLLSTYLRKEVNKLHEKNVRLRAIGRRSAIPEECQDLLLRAEALTERNTGLQLTLAISYGGRSELVDGMQAMARKVQAGLLRPEDISQEVVEAHLSTQGLPDPDFLIRTSGEQRISNFLLWQMAYTEFYFTPVHWPDFTKHHFIEAIEAYGKRERRFGGLDDNHKASPAEAHLAVKEISC